MRTAAHCEQERRAELGLGEDEVVALTVGKLSKRKRPADLIDSARRIKAANLTVPVRFVLAGSGEELERLEEIVRSEDLPVLMPGFINLDVLPSYLRGGGYDRASLVS